MSDYYALSDLRLNSQPFWRPPSSSRIDAGANYVYADATITTSKGSIVKLHMNWFESLIAAIAAGPSIDGLQISTRAEAGKVTCMKHAVLLTGYGGSLRNVV